MSTPMILRARAVRIDTGARSGRRATWSSIGPAWPPQMSRISRVRYSMCSTVVAGSTPRSKRAPASVAKL